MLSFFSQLAFGAFMNDFFSVLTIPYILMSILKSIVFGFVIAITASYEGMSVYKASTEVPQRTIKAVVISIFLVLILILLFPGCFGSVPKVHIAFKDVSINGLLTISR